MSRRADLAHINECGSERFQFCGGAETLDDSLASRDIACETVSMRGEDARDRKYISDLTKRVSKALRQMKAEGLVRSVADANGNLSWERR